MPILQTLRQMKDGDNNVIAEIIEAAPNTESDAAYIRLQNYTEPFYTYKWNDLIVNFNDSISSDPTQEPRWEQE